MNYLESLAGFLRGKFGFGERRRSAPQQLFQEPHQALSTSKLPRRTARKVTQYTVASQTEEHENEPTLSRLNASSLLLENSNNSEDPTNTAPHMDTEKQLLPRSEAQP